MVSGARLDRSKVRIRHVVDLVSAKGGGATIESQSPRRAAYIDSPLTIDPSDVVLEVNGVNRFLPLPEFQKPYFVYRD